MVYSRLRSYPMNALIPTPLAERLTVSAAPAGNHNFHTNRCSRHSTQTLFLSNIHFTALSALRKSGPSTSGPQTTSSTTIIFHNSRHVAVAFYVPSGHRALRTCLSHLRVLLHFYHMRLSFHLDIQSCSFLLFAACHACFYEWLAGWCFFLSATAARIGASRMASVLMIGGDGESATLLLPSSVHCARGEWMIGGG